MSGNLAELVTSNIEYIPLKGFNQPILDVILLFRIPSPFESILVQEDIYLISVEYKGTLKGENLISSYGINPEYDNPPILNGLKGYLKVNQNQIGVLKSIFNSCISLGIKWGSNRISLKENIKGEGYIQLNLIGKDIEFLGMDIDIDSQSVKIDKRRKGVRLQLKGLVDRNA